MLTYWSFALTNDDFSALHELLQYDGPLKNLILSVMGLSPFLRSIMIRQPQMLQDCLLSPINTHLDDLCGRLDDDLRKTPIPTMAQAMTSLRLFKQNTALTIALYDIAGIESVEQIVRRITQAADCAVQSAVSHLFRHRQEAGKLELVEGMDPVVTSGYFVLAMGKQGGFELNYSSDIDLIVLYDTERLNLASGCRGAKPFLCG